MVDWNLISTFPCSKEHSIRAYLDTIQKTLHEPTKVWKLDLAYSDGLVGYIEDGLLNSI